MAEDSERGLMLGSEDKAKAEGSSCCSCYCVACCLFWCLLLGAGAAAGLIIAEPLLKPKMSRTDKEVDELAQVVLQLVHDQKLTQEAWQVEGDAEWGKDLQADSERIMDLLRSMEGQLSPEVAAKLGIEITSEDIAKILGLTSSHGHVMDLEDKNKNAFQGDMVPEDTKQLKGFVENAEQQVQRKQRGSFGAGKPWKDGIVNYCFHEKTKRAVKEAVHLAIQQYKKAVPCLQFNDVGRMSGNRCEVAPAILIKSEDAGCWSYVGMLDHREVQELNLQSPGCDSVGTALHEMGHALGMAHEQSRPDRDKYVKIHESEIKQGKAHNFDISRGGDTERPYDLLSIMHYEEDSFSVRGRPTITAKAKAYELYTDNPSEFKYYKMGNRVGLTQLDADQLSDLYRPQNPQCMSHLLGGAREHAACSDLQKSTNADVIHSSAEWIWSIGSSGNRWPVENTMSQTLPAKDQAVFRSIVKFYETKQYKKGVKAADSILKKHPDHGETLCMKGLTLSYLDRKEEAYELVRKGVKCDLKSHVCWHVFGLLYRQDRDYHEAVKCYRQALRFDPENIQILRDLSLLQIHRRDVTGFAETRRKLLQVKPSNRINWVGYAIAEHLCKSYEFAWTCIDNYENSFKEQDQVSDYENSELHLYKASIMEEAGKFEEALECLRANEAQIVDKIGLLETRGRIAMFLGRSSEAAEHFKRLVKINPEHQVYALAYMASQTEFSSFWPPLPSPQNGEEGTSTVPKSMVSFPSTLHPQGMPVFGWLPPRHALKPQRRIIIGRKQHKRRIETLEAEVPLTDEQQERVVALFEELREDFPKSDSLKRLPLFFITGPRFKRKLDEYLRARLRKGVPSLFRTLRSYYYSPEKPQLVEELLLQYAKCLREDISWFGPLSGEQSEPPKMSDEEPPTALLFTLMTLAEHFDFMGETHKALEYVNEAIEHTPTLVELYACKARIYKHAGDLETSAKCYEEVREMDLADRYLNTQCVRALLRIDETQQGMEKALLFSKEPDSQEAANLHEMQCMWYESAVGRSYYRQKKYGKALKQFHETFKHFSDIAEDQFDFHNYCLRKTTLKAYVSMLRMQERLYSHKFYRRAAKDAVKIYLELYDAKVSGVDGDDQAGSADGASKEGGENELSAEEKKKMKHKKKREAQKQEQKATTPATTATGKPKKVDDDPEGEKLLQQDFMEQACKIVRTMVTFSALDSATHVMTYEVFSRQKKSLHCLQALRQLWELGGRDSLYYKLLAPLAHFCFVLGTEIPEQVADVVFAEIAVIIRSDEGAVPFKSAAEMKEAASKLVDAVEQKIKTTNDLFLVEVLYGLKCLKAAGRDRLAVLEAWQPQGAMSLKESRKLLAYLEKEFGKDSAPWAKLQRRCLEFFPLMVIA